MRGNKTFEEWVTTEEFDDNSYQFKIEGWDTKEEILEFLDKLTNMFKNLGNPLYNSIIVLNKDDREEYTMKAELKKFNKED